MLVWVTLYGGLVREGGSGKRFGVEIPEGATVGTLAEQLEIKHRVALVSVNGIKTSWETLLNPGDQVVIFPPVTGGTTEASRPLPH